MTASPSIRRLRGHGSQVLSGKLHWVVNAPTPAQLSCSGGRRSPCLMRRRSEAAKGRSGYEVLLDVEGVVDGGVGGEEPLG